MAKHRGAKRREKSSPKRTSPTAKHHHRTTPSLILLGTAAAGLTTALVLSQATYNTADSAKVLLVNAAIGVGGRGDPTAANIPAKLQGNAQPTGYGYEGVNYPAGFDIDNSVTAGVPTLDGVLKTQAGPPGQSDPPKILVVGYSEGALVAERERRNLANDAAAPPPSQVSFVLIASANLPNGGIFSRLPGLNIPFFVSSNGPAGPSEYTTTFVTNEYDPYGDFPAYFNLLSLANTIAAIQYVHPDAYYDSVDYDPISGTAAPGVLVTHVTRPDGNATETYVFVHTDHLPLLAPLRQGFAAVGLTPFTEPILGAVEPLIRVGVDMGYTDRLNLDPGTAIEFSFITPQEKIAEALAAMPGAIQQGQNNFMTGVAAIPGSAIPLKATPLKTTPLNTTPSPLLAAAKAPAINAKPAPQDEPKLSITDTPPKEPLSSPKEPLSAKAPLSAKEKVGPLKLAQDGHFARPGRSDTGFRKAPFAKAPFSKAPFAKAPSVAEAPPSAPAKPSGEPAASNGPSHGPAGNAA